MPYDAYKAVIRSFQVYFHLGAFTFRQVDKFLWLTKTEFDARPSESRTGTGCSAEATGKPTRRSIES